MRIAEYITNRPLLFVVSKHRNLTRRERISSDLSYWWSRATTHMVEVIRHPRAWLRWRWSELMRGLFPYCVSFDAHVSYWVGKGKK